MGLKLEVPGSKSVTQRALIIAALRPGQTTLDGALCCDDSRVLSAALNSLGCPVRWEGTRVFVGEDTLRATGQTLFCQNAGTAVRFLSALSLVIEGDFVVDGDAHMRRRPIGPLGDALRLLGVEVSYLQAEGCPPLRLSRAGQIGAQVEIDTRLSSQYASGILLAAPLLPQGIRLRLVGPLVSLPYLKMTTQMMKEAGARVRWISQREIVVEPGGYAPASEVVQVEPDWSGAGLLLTAAWAAGCPLDLSGLSGGSALQGDAVFPGLLEQLDEPAPRVLDLKDTPDLLPPLAVAAALVEGETRFVGIAHAKIKECDRPQVLARALQRLGIASVELEEDEGTLSVVGSPPCSWSSSSLVTEGDHRMAMAFSILKLRKPEIEVDDRACVSKSFPDWWEVWGALRDWRSRLERAMEGRVVALVGLRGSGKTTLMGLLSRLLGVEGVDADQALAERVGESASGYLEREGEAAFRAYEEAVSATLLSRSGPLILSTGGGVVLHEALLQPLKEATTLWLDPPLQALVARLKEAPRPALGSLAPEEELRAQHQARRARYEEVSRRALDTERDGVRACAEGICAALVAGALG